MLPEIAPHRIPTTFRTAPDQVRAVVAHPTIRNERRMLGAFLWLFPTFIVGGGVVLLSHVAEPIANNAVVLIGAMVLIGLIVFSVSRDVAIFLVDAGCSRSSSSASRIWRSRPSPFSPSIRCW